MNVLSEPRRVVLTLLPGAKHTLLNMPGFSRVIEGQFTLFHRQEMAGLQSGWCWKWGPFFGSIQAEGVPTTA